MSTTITAAVLTKQGEPLELQQVLIDDPLDHEVLVRVERVGLCHSDLHYVHGSLGHRHAHDPWPRGGRHRRAHRRRGDPAAGRRPRGRHHHPRLWGVRASASGVGRPSACAWTSCAIRPRPKHTTLDGEPIGSLGGIGAFAEAVLVNETALGKVDKSVPPAVACLLGCCVTTGVGAVVHGAEVAPDQTVAVIGCGGVGVSAIQGARLAGARKIIAIDAVADKLDLARKFGATDVVLADPDKAVTVQELHQIVPGGVDHAFEAVGRTVTAELAFECLAPTGVATILGLMPEGSQLSISADALVYGDRGIRGAYMGANRFLSDVEMFTDHYNSGRLDLDAMVTKVLTFAQINEGLDAMADPDTVRVVLDMSRADA